jgi:hypothetical protein
LKAAYHFVDRIPLSSFLKSILIKESDLRGPCSSVYLSLFYSSFFEGQYKLGTKSSTVKPACKDVLHTKNLIRIVEAFYHFFEIILYPEERAF